MKQVAIITNFHNYDPGHSLCRIVANQIKMLVAAGYEPRVIVRDDFYDEHYEYPDGVDWWPVVPGPQAELNERATSHEVIITETSGAELDALTDQLRAALDDRDVVLTHDLIYHSTYWKYHVACRRLALERPDLRWIHWVHSATPLAPKHKLGPFRRELDGNFGKFPNSRIVAFHEEEVERKGRQFNYDPGEVVIVPNPTDFTADFEDVAKLAVDGFGRWPGLWDADAVGIYPCRLDRGKQPHILLEVFAQLRRCGWDARVVIVDFHSTAGDKVDYRDEMKHWAWERDLPVLFTSDLPDAGYVIPHKAVMDLLEFADVLVHPSRSECDPLVIPEAAWKRCGLVLNFDLSPLHQYAGRAQFGKFGSNVNLLTGMAGQTFTEYEDREGYMTGVAMGIAYQLQNDRVLALHREIRKRRSLRAVWRRLEPLIEGEWQ